MEIASYILELRALLGNDVLLLSWPWGMKGDKRRWKHLTAASMNVPAYLQRLGEGNIGVAQGAVSGGLCSVDVDSDEQAVEFVRLNPAISNTLCSQGSRGYNWWWRFTGPYPALTKLKRHGSPWGEFRSTGGQTLIYGQHPDGMLYTIVNKVTPLVISMDDIVWPVGMTPQLSAHAHYTETPERTEKSEQTELPECPEATDGNRCGKGDAACLAAVRDVEHAVSLSLPTATRQNHHYLFDLARAIKTLEAGRGSTFTIAELKHAFDQWHHKATSVLRDGTSRDEYWFEFLEGYENALHPLGINVVNAAWELAVKNPPPPEAAQFETREVRLLVGLCFELQKLCGKAPFFLSVRTVQRLFGHPNHGTAAFWLGGLRRTKVIKVVEQGGPKNNKATRFRYCSLA